MALLFLDGFDHYSSSAQANRKWTAGVGTGSTGRFGRGTCAIFGNATIQKVLASNVVTLICGFAFQQTTGLTVGQTIVAFRDGTSVQVLLALDSNFNFAVYRGTTANLLGTASGVNAGMKVGTWYYIELKVKIDPSVGTVDLHINSSSVLSLTGQNTRATANSSASQLIFTGTSSLSNNLYDDLYVADTTTSFNNDFLGEIEVRTTFPTGDSAVQFTRSTGATNALNVDDPTVNDDTDYNEDAVVGDKDIFTLTALSPAVTTVKSVVLTTTFRNTDASARSGRANLKSSATTVNGATVALTASYVVQQDIFDTDPNGAIAWTPTSMNAALPEYEVVS